MFPSLVSVEVAAKSFVFPRCSNFNFSRPHKLFRRAVFAGCWFPYGAIPARPRWDYPAAHSMSRIIGVLVERYYSSGLRSRVLEKKMWKKGRGTTATKGTASQLAEKLMRRLLRSNSASVRLPSPVGHARPPLRNLLTCINLRLQNHLGQRFPGPGEPLEQWPTGCTGIDMDIKGSETRSSAHANQARALEVYDVVILGGGTGSTVAAWTFASQGQRVAVIERKYIGGSCPNIACLPSKNILHSARIASYFRRGKEFGMFADGFHVDMAAVLGRKRAMVSGLNDMYLDNFKQTGAEFILGSGRFVGPKTVEVTLPGGTTRRLHGANVIVSTGTRAALEPIPGLADAQPLTHIEALELDQVPEQLIVLGGGYVGVELAQGMRRFGSKVTLIDRNDRLLHREDDDVTKALADLFTDEGIDTVLNARPIRISGKSDDSVTVVVEQGGREKTLVGTHLLVAAGRRPNTENIGLESAGIDVTDRGFIKVNERLETTAPGVWAIGEVAGSPQFTHVSVDDFRVVRDNLEGGNHLTTGRLIPYTLFTDPELARVGLNEKEAKARGMAYRLFKIPMDRVLRARTVSETRGFLKALVEVAGNRILGFTAFAVDAGEIMASVQTAMIAGMPYTALRDAIWAHPTLVEGLSPLFSSAPSLSADTQTNSPAMAHGRS
jgi:pyruvate/2-oxoglutarate dehydrogenase complex dihydrolipoamide dehydrogenase (E3) component